MDKLRSLALGLLLVGSYALTPAQAQPTSSPTCGPPAVTVPAGSNVTFTWSAPTTNVDGSAISGVITYNLYNVTAPTPAPLLTGITSTSTTRTNLSVGTPCYALTASVAGVESALSAPVQISVVQVPMPPTTVTCTITLPAAAGSPATATCTTK